MEKEQEIKIEEISKEEFLNFLDNQRNYWEDVILRAQGKLFEIERTERKIRRLEERGYFIRFFTDGNNCFFEAKQKERIGFRKEGEE